MEKGSSIITEMDLPQQLRQLNLRGITLLSFFDEVVCMAGFISKKKLVTDWKAHACKIWKVRGFIHKIGGIMARLFVGLSAKFISFFI